MAINQDHYWLHDYPLQLRKNARTAYGRYWCSGLLLAGLYLRAPTLEPI
jgi:hypothetical protein